jgi:E3 ubiquitin-protein ligase HUWE1
MDIDGMGPIEGLPGDVDVEIELDGDEGMDSDDESEDDDEDEEEDDDDDMDDDDEDGEDDMDDMEEAIDAMEAMEEVTGDDENASLAEDQEDDWSDDEDDFPAGVNGEGMPPGALGFVLDPPQILEQMRQQGGAGDLEDFLDDDMGEEGALRDTEERLQQSLIHLGEDEDGEEYDEEIHYDPGMEDDEEGLPELGWGGGWEDPQPPTVRHTHRLSPWMFPAGPGDRILVPAYRSHRPGAGPRATDDGINPLLQRGGRSAGRDAPRNEGSSDWVHAIEPRGPRVFNQADSPVSFISNLLNAMSSGAGPQLHQHGGAIHLSFSNSMGLPPSFDSGMRREMARMRESYTSRSAREDPHSAVSFIKAYTNQRWQEEARILYGPAAIEKSQRVINSILKVMVPPAMEAAKKRQEEREAEVARKLKEEQEKKEKKEREEREAREAKEKEDREREEREAAEAASRAQEQAAEGDSEAKEEIASAPDAQAMEGVEADQSAADPAMAAEPAAERTPAAPPAPRIMTTLRGREYDITDLGIDTEYLDALPGTSSSEAIQAGISV